MVTEHFMGMWSVLLVASAVSAADPVLERFDASPIQGKMGEGAALEAGGGLEGGALKANGVNKRLQYFYSYEVQVTPGETYAFSFNYRSTPNLASQSLVALVAFDPVQGSKAPPSVYFKLSSTEGWRHGQFEFTAPEKTGRARVLLRLAGAPESESVWIDNCRFAPVVGGVAEGVDLTAFETAFDDWRLDRHPVFEHFMIRNGRIVLDWRQAKVGEAFFEAIGDGSKMQYALHIDDLRVKPRHNYVFQAWLQATDSFSFKAAGMLIFFYKDAENKALGQSRYYIRPTKGEWKEVTHAFTVPEKAAFVDIGLNLRNQPPSSRVRLDHLRFHPGEDKLDTRYEIDPDTQKMSVVNTLSGRLRPEDVKIASISVKTAGGDDVGCFSARLGEATVIDLAPLKDGLYALSSQITLHDGGMIAGKSQTFGVFNHPDWSNDLGIQRPDAPAPAPWRDLRFKDGVVKTWNNSLAFNDWLELRQISLGDGSCPLLRAPLEFSIDQRTVFTEGAKARWHAQPSLMTGTCPVRGERWTGVLTLAVDYSGFIRYTLDLAATQPVTLRSGCFGLKLESADFLNRSDGTWTKIGAVDLKVAKGYATKHLYNDMMFGNLERGVFVYVPKIYPATTRDYTGECILASQTGDLELRFIQEPLKLAPGQHHIFDFAVAPYPVRPAEHNWRKLRFRAGKNSNFDLVWQTSKLMKHCGSLMEQSDDQATAQYLKTAPEYQLVYQIPSYIHESIPQASYFAKKWRGQPARAYDMGALGLLPKGDIRQRSWTDLYIKSMVDSLKKSPWAGVYYDCFGSDTYAAGGEQYAPIFELRAFQERVYNAQRLSNPRSLTMSHCNMVGTLMTFSNVFLTGEQHRANFLTHKYYQDFMTLDCFRYETAANAGPDGMLLPQYRRKEDVDDPALAAHVVGMATLHNLMIYPNFIRNDIDLRIRDRQYAFGMQDAQFFGYWQPNPDGMATNDPEVKVSYWKTSRGVLATVFNNRREAVEFEFRTMYPFRIAEFYEPVHDQAVKLKEGALLRLEPYRPAYITLKP